MDSRPSRKLLAAFITLIGALLFPVPGTTQTASTYASSASVTEVQPTAEIGRLRFESALTGYRIYQDEPVGSWREANDLAGRIGGWKAYARETSQRDSGPSDPESVSRPMHGSGSHHPAGRDTQAPGHEVTR